LASPQTRNPAAGTRQRPLERAHLAYLATGLAPRHREAEAHDAVAHDQALHVVRLGGDQADADPVSLLGGLDGLDGLREKAARIQRENIDLGARRCDRVQDRLILYTEACGETDGAGSNAPDLGEAPPEVCNLPQSPVEFIGGGGAAPSQTLDVLRHA
jgi:hypothetical protein